MVKGVPKKPISLCNFPIEGERKTWNHYSCWWLKKAATCMRGQVVVEGMTLFGGCMTLAHTHTYANTQHTFTPKHCSIYSVATRLFVVIINVWKSFSEKSTRTYWQREGWLMSDSEQEGKGKIIVEAARMKWMKMKKKSNQDARVDG